MGYLPSVLATATMMHIIEQIEPHKSMEHQDHLLGVLKMSKVCSRTNLISMLISFKTSLILTFETPFKQDKVQGCYNLVVDHSKACTNGLYHSINPHKRKYEHHQAPDSPNGVIDAGFSSDSSNDSWALRAAASVCSSPEPSFKKNKTEEPRMLYHSLNRRVCLDIVGSPS